MFKRIVVAYDESQEAQRALETGLNLADELRSEVVVVTIAEPLPGFYNISAIVDPTVPDDLRRFNLDKLKTLQERAVASARNHRVQIRTELIEAAEVAGILQLARENAADLLVIGLRRHAGGPEWSGTLRQIANEIPCSILAVV